MFGDSQNNSSTTPLSGTSPVAPQPAAPVPSASAYVPPSPTPSPSTPIPEPTPYVPPAPRFSPPPKPKTPILPLLFGFLVVIIVAAVIGVVYYKNKLVTTSTPSPSPSVVAMASPETSSDPSAMPSSSSKASPSASLKPGSTIKPTVKPTVKPTATPTPKPTIAPQPTLDIRFGNPSVNVKQTIDEGKGDGRVINREYTSIQTGTFDEVSSLWSPRVTVCFHIVAGEEIKGKDLKYTFSVDDKTLVDDVLAQYDKLEAGRLYDWCHDVTTDIGKHNAKLSINADKSIKEYNYVNNYARLDWENLKDVIAPNYTITGPTKDADKTCLSLVYLSDNVTKNSDLKIEHKFDTADWATTTATTSCTTGTAGSEHTYSVKVTDSRGNANEQKKTFVLY